MSYQCHDFFLSHYCMSTRQSHVILLKFLFYDEFVFMEEPQSRPEGYLVRSCKNLVKIYLARFSSKMQCYVAGLLPCGSGRVLL